MAVVERSELLHRGLLLGLVLGFSVTAGWTREPTRVDFDREIRPLLAEHCF
mgnify:CR=1 FL=1